jgi:hypothetical protein
MRDPFKSPSVNRICNYRRTAQFTKFLLFCTTFSHTYTDYVMTGFMMYAIEMASGGMIYTHQVP